VIINFFLPQIAKISQKKIIGLRQISLPADFAGGAKVKFIIVG
jgi:hypothetical protein